MRLTWSGFAIFDHAKKFSEAIIALTQLIQNRQLRYQEDIHEGLDHAPCAIAKLYNGENKGKLLIKI